MRNFYSDPSVKSDFRITFSPNAVAGQLAPAVGFCSKVTGLTVKVEKYEIKEGGRATPLSIPVGIAPTVVTFESLLFGTSDGSRFLNYYLRMLTLNGPTGIHGKRDVATEKNSSVDVKVERLEPFSTNGNSRNVVQTVSLRYGMIEEYMPFDEIAPVDGVALNKLVICFDWIAVQ